MENPVNTVKRNVSPGKIVGWLLLGGVVFFALDFFGVTGWLLYPWTNIKAKFGKKPAA